ncbi:unnamed protein product [Caenorhabditis auriculariae]|uniref:Uncharacterized protein n=1 Tax=Caenorhabditis auriculariae TaxID=2777116 RepID=A0A8S1GTI7_9PELO|nr:unnamed protein product [Caenorhabditis auriculariae]
MQRTEGKKRRANCGGSVRHLAKEEGSTAAAKISEKSGKIERFHVRFELLDEEMERRKKGARKRWSRQCWPGERAESGRCPTTSLSFPVHRNRVKPDPSRQRGTLNSSIYRLYHGKKLVSHRDMEAKRRKTSQEDDEKSGEVPTSSSRPRKRREIKEASSITMAQMKLEDPETLRRSFVTLKLALSSAASVNQFVLNQPEVFKTIVLTFVTLSKKLGTQEFKEAEILQSCMSVLANCCNLSLMACLEMKQTFVQLPSVTVRLLENTQLPVSSKATLCRLIANLCAHKESAHWISQNALLIDRVCLLLESDHESIVKQSIRVVKNLVSTNFTRVCTSIYSNIHKPTPKN